MRITANYKGQCMNCDATTTVVTDKDSDLCGPCFFGEAAMIDDNFVEAYSGEWKDVC